MKTYAISIGTKINMVKAQDAARRAVQQRGEDLMLVSWHDRSKSKSGPMELFCDTPEQTVGDYARSRGAHYHVNVNSNDYNFYYTRVPENVSRLDKAGVLSSHRGIDRDRFENVQGG